MKKESNNNQNFKIKILASSFLFFALFACSIKVFGWTSPVGNPPTGNTYPPVNTSDNAQSKLGSIVITNGGLGINNGIMTLNGKNYFWPNTYGSGTDKLLQLNTTTGDLTWVASSQGNLTGDITSAGLVTTYAGTVPRNKGGTGVTVSANDTVLIGDNAGTAWAPSSIPNCTDTGGNHLNYLTASNSFVCGTSGGGGGGVTDGDYGDISVTGTGAVWTIDNGVINDPKIATDAVSNTKILNGAVTASKLGTQGTATDEFCLTSETGGGALLEWQTCGGGGAPSGTDKQTLRYVGTTLTAVSNMVNDGTHIGIGTGGATLGLNLEVVGSNISVGGVEIGYGEYNGATIYNTAMGNNALGFAVNGTLAGDGNSAFGDNSLFNLAFNSNNNTAFGAYSLQYLAFTSPMNDNTALGYNAGGLIQGGGSLTGASQSIFIGSQSKAKQNGSTNEIVIGYDATGNGTNTVTIGNPATASTYLGSLDGSTGIRCVNVDRSNGLLGYAGADCGGNDNLGNGVATTAITALAGLVGTPSITFASDTDTGMWSPGANTIAFSTVGLERMRIDANGALGIGTTAPSNKSLLDITSTTKGFLPPRMTKTQRNAITTPPAGLMIYQTDNTPGLRVYNGTNWMKYTETAD